MIRGLIRSFRFIYHIKARALKLVIEMAIGLEYLSIKDANSAT